MTNIFLNNLYPSIYIYKTVDTYHDLVIIKTFFYLIRKRVVHTQSEKYDQKAIVALQITFESKSCSVVPYKIEIIEYLGDIFILNFRHVLTCKLGE